MLTPVEPAVVAACTIAVATVSAIALYNAFKGQISVQFGSFEVRFGLEEYISA